MFRREAHSRDPQCNQRNRSNRQKSAFCLGGSGNNRKTTRQAADPDPGPKTRARPVSVSAWSSTSAKTWVARCRVVSTLAIPLRNVMHSQRRCSKMEFTINLSTRMILGISILSCHIVIYKIYKLKVIMPLQGTNNQGHCFLLQLQLRPLTVIPAALLIAHTKRQ